MAPRLARTLLIVMWLLVLDREGLAATQTAPNSCAEMTNMPFQIRYSTCEMARAVDTGMRRSATFRQLVERIGELNGIVYVDARFIVHQGTKRVLSGTLQHRITRAGNYRLLYVTVAPESGDRPVLTLAHELQHAIEVLESDAATDAAIEAVFARIGTHSSAGTFETTAALKQQRAVAKELSQIGK